MKEIIDVVHKSIHPFFDACEGGKEEPLSDKDKLLLSVNKAICNNLKALEQEYYGDYISKQEVLHILKEKWNMFSDADDAIQESIDTIESLRPVSSSENPNKCEDAISRREVLDVIDRELFKWDVIDEVRKLPPVTPQSKTGRWIHHKEKEFVCAEHWECSQCHRTTMTYPFIVNGIVNDNDYNAMYYCPKCGAKMAEPPVESEG